MPNEWILGIASAVQAVAAAIIACFTIKLAAATKQYAETTITLATATTQYAETARDQVAAQFRPMLVAVDVVRDGRPFVPEETDKVVHPIRLVIENVGAGPALNAVCEILRTGPGLPNQPTLMLQFGQTRIGTAAVGQHVEPAVVVGSAVMFTDPSNTANTDELVIEYEALDGRIYQTHVKWRGGRWWDHEQIRVDGRSSRQVDQAEMEARTSMVGV
jgi:hypothetical protein